MKTIIANMDVEIVYGNATVDVKLEVPDDFDINDKEAVLEEARELGCIENWELKNVEYEWDYFDVNSVREEEI